LELAESPPYLHQRVLERVVGVVGRGEHPVAVRVELGNQRSHEAVVCRVVPLLGQQQVVTGGG